jgi:copper(I)-binding protein
MKKSIVILCFSLLTAFQSTLSIAAQADDIEVSSAYAREVPPGAPSSACFMTFKNTSGSDIKLVSAKSSAAKQTELHTHTNDNGVMRMRQIPFIMIPASGKTHLEPGGLHIMLIDPFKPLKRGKQVEVTLKFADGSHKKLSMPVKSVMRMGHH